jgi:repressor of nif and glnA expression
MDSPLKFVNHRIEEYALKVTYRPEDDGGSIIYNASLIHHDDLDDLLRVLKDACRAGLCVSNRLRVVYPGETVGDVSVSGNMVGILTMCSITLDALLLRKGVPLNPIGGGIVEIQDRIPRRFTTIIRYESTTIDPLQVLISQEMTSVQGVMNRGNGSILANLRECHMETEALVGDVLDNLLDCGFTGVLDVGVPNAALLGVPVTPEYFGIAMVGGTNPIAAFRESGKWAQTMALKGLIDSGEIGYISDY